MESGLHIPVSGNLEKSTQDLLCAILFNVQGLLHERLLGRDVGAAPSPAKDWVQGWSRHDPKDDLPLYLSDLCDWPWIGNDPMWALAPHSLQGVSRIGNDPTKAEQSANQ